MALGKRQKEILDDLAVRYKKEPSILRFQVNITARRSYTREFGSGIAITITTYECYPEADYALSHSWIADCKMDYTAEDKGKEIARYLVAAGVDRDKVRLRRGNAKKEIKHRMSDRSA